MGAVYVTEAKRIVELDIEKKADHSAEGAAFLRRPATRSQFVVSEKVSWSSSLTALLYLNSLCCPAVGWVKWRRPYGKGHENVTHPSGSLACLLSRAHDSYASFHGHCPPGKALGRTLGHLW